MRSVKMAAATALLAIATPLAVGATANAAPLHSSVQAVSSQIDCTPVGVTTYPDGSHWYVEDCNGMRIPRPLG